MFAQKGQKNNARLIDGSKALPTACQIESPQGGRGVGGGRLWQASFLCSQLVEGVWEGGVTVCVAMYCFFSAVSV